MSSICGIYVIFMSTIFIIIANGYAKDISGVERGFNRLNEYISHYETLDYDLEHVHASHNRAKRSVTKDHFVNLKFSAHGRNFHLRLKRDLNTFSDKLEILSNKNEPIDVATSHIYEGKVIGDRNSYVFGSILNGIFEGKIITERDTFYVENAKHYFTNRTRTTATTAAEAEAAATKPPKTTTRTTTTTKTTRPTTSTNDRNSSIENLHLTTTTTKSTATRYLTSSSFHNNNLQNTDGFHSVIYNDKHVDDPYSDVREGHAAGCGITDEVSQWMENIQNSAVEEPEELPKPMSKDERRKHVHKKSIDNNKTTTTTTATATATKNFVYTQEDEIEMSSGAKNHNDDDTDNNNQSNSNKRRKKSNHQHPPKKYSNVNVNPGKPSMMIPAKSKTDDEDFKYPYQKYSKEANIHEDPWSSSSSSSSTPPHSTSSSQFYDDSRMKFIPIDADWHERVHERIRRASGSSSSTTSSSSSSATSSAGNIRSREDNKNTCSLYIQTDPLIWRHIREGIVDHDRGRKYEIDEKTREEILSLIAHHVTAVNYIYRNTKFDGRTEHRNIRFEVQRIKIDDDSACRNSYNGPHNAFCNEHMDVSNFLNLHSLENHSDFCLAYVFTYRDFTGGTLGLAWVASASGASGGICEKYKTYTETVGGQYQSTKRSLNTGIITFVNYNSRVPPKVSQLTLAHEIGHNFGSPHDYPQECRPGGLNGNYIMFASATSGDRPNNSKFSPCSIRNISNVLDVLVGNLKRDCFKASEGAFCGNKIVESGEECDCGFNEEECKDNCCYPRLISEYDLSLNSSATGCTRRAKTQCSPSQGPCCLSNSCTFVPTNYHMKCKEETECSWSSTCNGTTAECPEPRPRDDKTKCNNGTALCIKGECSGSICLLWNMAECFLTSSAVPMVNKRKLCELACQNGNDTNTCRSTSEFAHLYGLPDGGISLRPGSPCDNFQGYCDVFLKCRAVDADGPLLRLKNLLLNKETLQTVAEWVIENWYMVVLMGIGFIIVMGIFIKCCAVHTPSSNPKKRRARRISETLRAPMNTLRRMRHPHGRGAGPRSIPPPVHEQRSRHHPPDWDRRHHPDHHRVGGGGGRSGQSLVVPGHSSEVAGHSSHESRPSGRSGGGSGGGGGADARHHSRHHGASSNASGRPGNSSRSSASGSHHHGYGDGRGPQNYPPKVVGPQPVNYNRPPSLHNPELYAEAYSGRGAYEVPTSRAPNSKV